MANSRERWVPAPPRAEAAVLATHSPQPLLPARFWTNILRKAQMCLAASLCPR